jgi:hypothetical protein
MIAEVTDSIGEPCCKLGRITTSEVFGAEILVTGTVAQHVKDNYQDRCGNGDDCFLGSAASFEAQELRL